MAQLSYHRLEQRSQPALNLAILFGIIAAVMVVVCVVWNWGVPRMRRRRSQNLYRRRWNNNPVAVRTQPRLPRFPTHPVIDHFTSQQTVLTTYDPRIETPFPRLPTYNPRNETPFPNYPGNALHSAGSTMCNRVGSAPAATTTSSSSGLFTPTRGSAVDADEVESNFCTVPRGPDAKSFVDRSADFGDARDLILAVPEPLVLKPRPSGRPPAVVRHLQRYGTPHSNSPASSDKHLHPNKLFRALQQGNSVRDSYCSSTTMRPDQGEWDSTRDCDAIEMIKVVDKAAAEKEIQGQRSRGNSEASSEFDTNITQDQEQPELNPSLTAMHRLRSYRSLTGSRVSRITRAGTVSRPKTPINELKKLYSEERSITVPSMGIPRYGTISTVTTGFGPSSENESISTPASSPFQPSYSLSMLPTPLRPRKDTGKSSDIDYAETINSRPATSHGSQDENKVVIPTLQTALNKKREQRSSRGFYHTGRRNKPAPPNINTDIQTPTIDNDWPLRTFTDIHPDVSSDTLSKDRPRKVVRASSIYSRDTFGMSLQTPTTAEGSSPIADVLGSSNPFRSRESIKTRINQWNQRIEGHPLTPRIPRTDNISPAMSTTSIRDYFETAKAEDKSIKRFGRDV